MSAGICGDRQPGGTGFVCTLAPAHGGVMHEARSSTGGLYASWTYAMPRPQVRITDDVWERLEAFAQSETGQEQRQRARQVFEAAGIEVIE
jgi:hypothetical protein